MTIRLLWHNSRESILDAVSGIATDCSGTKAERATKLCNDAHKGKRCTDLSDLQQCVQRRQGSTDLSDLSLSRWLDDAAIQQGANRVSCQVTVVVVVTGIDVSSTGSRKFDGDSRYPFPFSFFLTSGSHNLWCLDYHHEAWSRRRPLAPFHQPTERTSVVWTGLLG